MISAFLNWYNNTSSQCDKIEMEQAGLRLLISTIFMLYVITHMVSLEVISSGERIGLYYLITFIFLSSLIFASIIYKKNVSIIRRLLGAWLDIGGTTLFMSLTSDVGVVLIGVYLFVTFGNGFRYGKKYLYHAQILSILGFFITLNTSPFWGTHYTIAYSLMTMLVVLPLYVAQLITRLNDAKQKAEIASKRAEEANHAKTRFVANMSHEIRTPLNGIIGISTLFKSTPLNSNQQDLLKTLESSSKLLLSILNNVLDFTKIEEHKLNIEHTPFSVEETVCDTLEIFKTQAQAKGVQVSANISDSLGILKGDAVVLRQVLANLMGNAVKFTEKGSVIISATLLSNNDKQATVRFSVEDSGVGIPANKLDKIFESFTQADASTTRKFGGSGLGLTIAKHMVEAMGSKLIVQSTEGVGSRFWFDLTMTKEIVSTPAAANPISTVEPISKARSTNIAKPLNILICEDESTNQKILSRLLELPGHHVDIASSADEMLDRLEHHTFDLVITDLNMADMSGTEAIKIYRFTRPDDKSTRFILFTADATLSARQEASDAGFDAFLTKPVDAATLFNTIEKIMNLAPNTATMWMNAALNNPVNIETDLAPDNLSLDISTLTALERIGGNDQLFMHRLLKNYLSDALQLIYKIETAAKDRHYGDLQDYCHALKGNSLSVGALQLAQTMEELGKISSSVSQTQVLDMLKRMNKEFSDLTMAVEDYLRRPEAASHSH